MQVSVAKNTATNYLVMLIRFFQGLLVTRWLIGYLGDSGYGFWMLLWTFFGYAILIDFGVGIAGQNTLRRSCSSGIYGITMTLSP